MPESETTDHRSLCVGDAGPERAVDRLASHDRATLSSGLAVVGLASATIAALLVVQGDGAILSWLPAFGVGALGLAALLGAYSLWAQRRTRMDLVGLAAWHSSRAAGDAMFLPDLLQQVSRLHGARRALLIQPDADEDCVRITAYDQQGCRAECLLAAAPDALLDGALAGHSFICEDFHRPVNRVLFRSPVGLQRWRGRAVDDRLLPWLKARRVVSCPLFSGSVQGRLFVMDGRRGGIRGLLFTEAVGTLVTASLERSHQLRTMRDRAIVEERSRISRDLHDGLLQSMTAWALQIGDIANRVEGTDLVVAGRLHDIHRQIAVDQRDLRTFIGRLNSERIDPLDFSLIGRLHDLRDRFLEEWGLRVDVDFSGLHALVPATLRAEICRLAHEALANAARHAQTSLARVEVAATDDGVFIAVEDRGSGFPFHGRFDLANLRAQGKGPCSLIERVSALDGELVLESSSSGSRIEIILPFVASGGRRGEHAS